MSWRVLIPNAVSLAAMAAGLGSILAATSGNGITAAHLIILAMLLDGLDGNLARRLNSVTPFGAELDAYVDMIAFGIAPAVLIYKLFPDYGITRFSLPIMTAWLGAIRLSRFKVQDPFRGQKGYKGLPITIAAGWTALFATLHENNWMIPHQIHPWLPLFFVSSLLLCLLLQVSNLHYPKPTKTPSYFAICTILVLMFLLPNPRVNQIAVYLMFLSGLGYVLSGLLGLHQNRDEKNKISN